MSRLAMCSLALAALVIAAQVHAGPESSAGEAPRGAPPAAEEAVPDGARPALGLDSLLTPRGQFSSEPQLRGGRDRAAWREAFQDARSELADLERRVAETQRRIREVSKGEWDYTPVGSGDASDPEVLKLRAQLKRDRQSLEAAQTRLRDLEVEASLSGVPDSWRELPPQP